jgi:hypothetical protein
VYVERAPHVHQPHYPPASPTHQPRTGFSLPLAPLAASTSLATSSPRTSPHARPLVSTATPTLPPTRRGNCDPSTLPPQRARAAYRACAARHTCTSFVVCVVAAEGVSSWRVGVVVKGSSVLVAGWCLAHCRAESVCRVLHN